MTDTCEHCGLERQPAHFGDPRGCAFKDETFSGNNWNCGLVSSIRRAFSDGDGRESLHYRNDDISTYGALVVAVPEYDEFYGFGYGLSGLLVGSWYKERGRVDDLKWAFRSHGHGDETLTRTEAIRIAAWLREREEEPAPIIWPSAADKSTEQAPALGALRKGTPVYFSSSALKISPVFFTADRHARPVFLPHPALSLTKEAPEPQPAPGKKPKRRFPIPR
ncbi:hypothetical protein [Deinococcus sp. QL22]|uniref:hypothetical protein n=1 Tax=Deinococcus sp. QL22 TaxID=2939437 RepID=UPI002017759B|nr:hypothetical protein [Deinococcus sp. QL22]UQN10396.1 hypothetical protein M1R55_30040 [Deinococcus sp. QL22]UQN10530.1 hypothetical protein M1R55_29365 [Deinococcus sp. QL22]